MHKDSMTDFFTVSQIRNYFNNDPLLDWLQRFGEKNGYSQDPPGSEKYNQLVMKKGKEFEEKIYSALGVDPLVSSFKPEEDFEKTVSLLSNGINVLSQATLVNYSNNSWGIADLIVSKNWFLEKYPQFESKLDGFDGYLVGEIKFKKAKNGKKGYSFEKKDRMFYVAQLKTYIDATSKIVPVFKEGFILARDPPPIPHNGRPGTPIFLPIEKEVNERISSALSWLKKVIDDGENIFPGCCSEMYSNMNNHESFPWSNAKKQIAEELDEITRITEISISMRNKLHNLGVFSGAGLARKVLVEQDPEVLSLLPNGSESVKKRRILAVLEANYGNRPLFIPRNDELEAKWLVPSNAEFFVDFETFNSVNDDFSRFPEAGGTPITYMIGCGDMIEGEWVFKCFVAREETYEEEKRIFSEFYDYLIHRCNVAGSSLKNAVVFHWASHEVTNTRKASERHNVPQWSELNWTDLGAIVKNYPLYVKGAFDYKLKSIAKALFRSGKIQTVWEEGGLGDGLTAMTISWEVYSEAKEKQLDPLSHPVMKEVIKYNEIDCKTTCEILNWMRDYLSMY